MMSLMVVVVWRKVENQGEQIGRIIEFFCACKTDRYRTVSVSQYRTIGNGGNSDDGRIVAISQLFVW